MPRNKCLMSVWGRKETIYFKSLNCVPTERILHHRDKISHYWFCLIVPLCFHHCSWKTTYYTRIWSLLIALLWDKVWLMPYWHNLSFHERHYNLHFVFNIKNRYASTLQKAQEDKVGTITIQRIILIPVFFLIDLVTT